MSTCSKWTLKCSELLKFDSREPELGGYLSAEKAIPPAPQQGSGRFQKGPVRLGKPAGSALTCLSLRPVILLCLSCSCLVSSPSCNRDNESSAWESGDGSRWFPSTGEILLIKFLHTPPDPAAAPRWPQNDAFTCGSCFLRATSSRSGAGKEKSAPSWLLGSGTKRRRSLGRSLQLINIQLAS